MKNPKPLCIYHGNCADGFTAAYAVWSRFGDEFEYHAGVYQDAPPDVRGRDVVLVDFSYKRDVLLEMSLSARSILVLDHHKSAAADLAPGGQFVDVSHLTTDFGRVDPWERHKQNTDRDCLNGAKVAIYTLFDMNRSGAGIAWDFFHRFGSRPRLVDYVEDRDLWRFELPYSREVSAYIFSHDYTFDAWAVMDAALLTDLEGVVKSGRAIERKHHKDVAELVSVCRRELAIGGQWVPAASLPYTLTSDAGHLMCEPYASANLRGEMVTPPFAACYWDTPEGRVFSLRSRDGGADVSEIAKLYGGGGHKNAAGFRVPFAHLDADGSPKLPMFGVHHSS